MLYSFASKFLNASHNAGYFLLTDKKPPGHEFNIKYDTSVEILN